MKLKMNFKLIRTDYKHCCVCKRSIYFFFLLTENGLHSTTQLFQDVQQKYNLEISFKKFQVMAFKVSPITPRVQRWW